MPTADKAIILANTPRLAPDVAPARIHRLLAVLSEAGFRAVLVLVPPAQRHAHASTLDHAGPSLRVDVCGKDGTLSRAESFTGGDAFLALDPAFAHPRAACLILRALGEPAVALFRRDLARFTRVPTVTDDGAPAGPPEVDRAGYLRRLAPPAHDRLPSPLDYLHVGCRLLDPSIFRSLRAVGAGDWRDTDRAVQHSVDVLRIRYKALRLDLRPTPD
jgi:hypothetical protein